MSKRRPQHKRLTERVANPLAGARVDREAGVIRGVLLCGFTSANARDYPASVLREAAAKYERRPVNYDHAREGTVARRAGWVENVRAGDDGRPRGDLHLLKSHPNYGAVIEAAERNPSLFGMSHVAHCRTSTRSGREVVEAIERVESIDLVADPATTQSLFESRTMSTLKTFVEALVRHPKVTTAKALKLKALAEMDGMGDLPMDAPMPAPEMDEPDTDEAVMSAFKAAISSVVDKAMSGDMDPKAALSKIKTLLNSHGSLNDDGSPDTDGDTSTVGGADGDDTTPESKRPTLTGLLAECKAAGLANPTTDQLAALSEITSEAGRLATIGLLKKATEGQGAERPKSGAPRASRVTESAPVPTDAKSFAASVRE